MKPNWGLRRRVIVWLGVACLSLVATSPLFARQPTLRNTLKAGQPNVVLSVAFGPDGKTLASGGDDTVTLWDVAAGKEQATLQ